MIGTLNNLNYTNIKMAYLNRKVIRVYIERKTKLEENSNGK
jgi:hypothetical protein